MLDSTPVSLGKFVEMDDVMCMTHQRNRVHDNFKPQLSSVKGNNSEHVQERDVLLLLINSKSLFTSLQLDLHFVKEVRLDLRPSQSDYAYMNICHP